MPAPTVPELGQFNYVQETKNLDWADLVTLDFSKYGTPEGKKELAQELIRALREDGFFYVKNFNIPQEQVNRQFSLGKHFYELPLEEKLAYVPEGLDNGAINGYVPAGRSIVDPASGLRDRIEIYNIPRFHGGFDYNYPAIIQDHLDEIQEFAKSMHSEVLDPLHILLAIALELPNDYFTNIHRYDRKSEDHCRYMKFSKHTPEDNKKLNGIWTGGHTDPGSWTLLFRQPVAALQIKNHKTGEWKWVKPQNGTLTVNACDALSFLTGGYVKSTIHRVALPPQDQQHVDRLGVLYFCFPNDDVKLATMAESPVLQREGYIQNEFEKSGNPVPTTEGWTSAKRKWQRSFLVRGDVNHKTAQILPGFSEKVYD